MSLVHTSLVRVVGIYVFSGKMQQIIKKSTLQTFQVRNTYSSVFPTGKRSVSQNQVTGKIIVLPEEDKALLLPKLSKPGPH